MGWEVEANELANMMLALQEKGSRNISLVGPSHVVAQILAAVLIAAQRGLCLPLMYESDGYDSPEALALLDGVIDVYMPDMKYGETQTAISYSHAADYVEASRRAVKEMYRQVGGMLRLSSAIAGQTPGCHQCTELCGRGNLARRHHQHSARLPSKSWRA